ncbi:hypothetical protein ACFQZE_06055 [Paenibacillus sp. GCM10027627]|uniref:hypothetical protein n=1 Tax=unclassified Paenibacillus TaxID=185978 RepID=UPI003628D413
MTFKPLDLQMSVPRTPEFGGKHQQAVQRPLVEQNMLASQSAKQTEQLRTQNAPLEQSSKAHVRADQEGSKNGGNGKQEQKRTDKEAAEAAPAPEIPVHPYKGRNFDIKL